MLLGKSCNIMNMIHDFKMLCSIVMECACFGICWHIFKVQNKYVVIADLLRKTSVFMYKLNLRFSTNKYLKKVQMHHHLSCCQCCERIGSFTTYT